MRILPRTEYWLVVLSRLLIGFGVGVLGVRYFPGFAGPLGLPALVVGALLFVAAAAGLWRSKPG